MHSMIYRKKDLENNSLQNIAKGTSVDAGNVESSVLMVDSMMWSVQINNMLL